MANITINQDYNAYEIVYKALNEPVTSDMFTFEDGVLTVEEATQEELEQALQNYDHQAYLNSIIPPKTEIELLKETVDALVLANLGV